MSMKPVLFNTEMVRALLAGEKTCTRRVIKPQPPATSHVQYTDGKFSWAFFEDSDKHWIRSPYQPGDILYVRETWAKLWYVDTDGYTHYDQPMYYYAADGTPDITLMNEDGFELEDQRIRWHPSIHMPKEAARIFLRVTDVRVERLQKMTVADFQKEGVTRREVMPGGCACAWATETCREEPCTNRDAYENMCWMYPFMSLWNSTMRPDDRMRYGYEANPWVWVIEFESYGKTWLAYRHKPEEGRKLE